jgi:hypothetical protein
MPDPVNTPANPDDEQVNEETGEPSGVAPHGAKTEGEIEEKKTDDEDDALRIDPNSRIPRPVPPDLA